LSASVKGRESVLARAFPIELKDGMRAEAAVVNRDLRFRRAATTASVCGGLLGEPIPDRLITI
jgi:hypothetical protein